MRGGKSCEVVLLSRLVPSGGVSLSNIMMERKAGEDGSCPAMVFRFVVQTNAPVYKNARTHAHTHTAPATRGGAIIAFLLFSYM